MALMIGIEIDVDQIRIVELEGNFGTYNLSQTRVLPVANGSEPLLHRQMETLQNWRSSLEGARIEYACSFSMRSSSTRWLQLPFTDSAKIAQILPYQLEEQMPFNVEEVSIFHRIASTHSEGATVFACITPFEQIEKQLSFFNSINIDPMAIIPAGDALSAFGSSNQEVVLHMQQDTTLCTLLSSGKTIGLSTLPIGLTDLKSAVARQMNLSEDSVDETLKNLDLRIPPTVVGEGNSDSAAITQFIKIWTNQIKNLLISFEDKAHVEIDNVLLSGKCSSLNGLPALLSEHLGVPVSSVFTEDNIDPEFHLAYNLAQYTTGDSMSGAFNLRKDNFAYSGDMAYIGKLISLGSYAFVAIVLLSCSWFSYKYFELTAQRDELNASIMTEIEDLFSEEEMNLITDAEMAFTQVMASAEEKSERERALSKIISTTPPTLNLLKEVSVGMAEHNKARIDVTELTINKTSINLKAETDGYDAASTIEQALQKRPMLKNAQKADEKKNRNEGIRFTIQIPLGEQNTEE
ncbi:MAG: hypothetical protein CMK59_13525 [Proteobacteria bacterium]|nr:hypothetical protein [Pseudomonadota bacterium]